MTVSFGDEVSMRVSFGNEANMHLVNPRHGLCVTCTVLRAVMFCYDANSCLRFTVEVAIK